MITTEDPMLQFVEECLADGDSLQDIAGFADEGFSSHELVTIRDNLSNSLSERDSRWLDEALLATDPCAEVAEAATSYHRAVKAASICREHLITTIGTAIDQGCAHDTLAPHANLSRQSITKYADAYRRANEVAVEPIPSLPRAPTG